MSVIPEQNDVLKSVGSFIGEQAINATAIASAIIPDYAIGKFQSKQTYYKI
jgi:hypothetical protein